MHGMEGVLMTAGGLTLVYIYAVLTTRHPKQPRRPAAPPAAPRE